jgi:penicillin G amidase
MTRIAPFFVTALTVALTTLFNIGISNLPPLGKLLDPFQGVWQNAETQFGNLPNSLALPGLKECVTVRFDKYLIPHITAHNDADLYFAQGYITAFHRLWQMDFQTYAAAGRMAEIMGPKALDFDRLQRRKGNLYAANNALAQIKKDSTLYNIVQAYVAGVNAYICTLSYKDLPLEYKLLDYRPEPWTPLKVALMIVEMINDLCGGNESIENTNAVHQLGREKFDFIFPAYFEKAEPVIPKNTPWKFKPITVQSPSSLIIPKSLNHIKEKQVSRTGGSNSWAVSGKKTITGTPYLANDPHLVMQLPSIWYGMHLQSPDVNVFGGTFPGLPFVAVGFNEAIAWGVTNAARNVKNWHVVDFKDETKQEYHYDNMLLRSQLITEEIKVRGSNSFYDTVIYTHFGPVVYDAQFPGCDRKNNLAMKWLGHHPGKELLSFYLLNRAKSYEDFEAAFQHYDVPSQNFAFAATNNDIAMYIAGLVPLQWKEQGRFILPGNTAAYEWTNFVPRAHAPKVMNPASGYVSSANERSTDRDYPYYYHHYNEEHYRNRRANQVLKKLNAIDEKAMMQMQNDSYNLAAQESLPLLLKHVDTNQLNEGQKIAYHTLLDWDYHNEVDRLAPSVFQAWQDQLQTKLWPSLQNAQWPTPVPCFYRTVEILKSHPNSPHLDLGNYATVGDLVHAAFVDGVQMLEAWQTIHQKPYRWGDYRQVFINHLANVATFGLSNLQISGGNHILNANEGNRGASMRLIVSLEPQPKGWFIYPGGQSGNPGSPHYTSFVESWRQGQYIPITISADQADGDHTLIMRPAL